MCVKYSEELHRKSREVVNEIKEYEGGAEDLTMNEMAIINHYENLLNDRPAVDTGAIERTARKLDGVTYQLEFIRNYFDLLATVFRKKHDHDSLVSLHMAFFANGTLQNMDKIIEKSAEVIDKGSVDLLIAIGEE